MSLVYSVSEKPLEYAALLTSLASIVFFGIVNYERAKNVNYKLSKDKYWIQNENTHRDYQGFLGRDINLDAVGSSGTVSGTNLGFIVTVGC